MASPSVTRFPNLFIVGAPKCGTTSMYEYLRGHPQVFVPEFKEPCYFSADLALDVSGNFLRYGRDEALYRGLFATAGDVPIIGEGSTRYLYSKDAPALIKSASPDARIVAMLRNPVDMIYSLHLHKLAAGTEDIADLAEALDAEDDRHAGRRIPPRSNPKLATYRDRARFGEQLARWIDVFGRERIHVIILEDTVQAPVQEFSRLLEFLEIAPGYRPASFAAHNVAHGARSPMLRRLVNLRASQWFAWHALPRLLGDARARGLARRLSHSRLQRRPIERVPVDPALREQLAHELTSDVAHLSSMLERDMAALWFGPGQSVGLAPDAGRSPAVRAAG